MTPTIRSIHKVTVAVYIYGRVSFIVIGKVFDRTTQYLIGYGKGTGTSSLLHNTCKTSLPFYTRRDSRDPSTEGRLTAGRQTS